MGRNRAGVESAQAARDIAVARYEKAIQTAFKEVADALTARQALAEQLQAQQQQTDAERERYRLVDLSYRNGVANSLDLLDAQRSLFGVEQALAQTRLAQRANEITLYKALGGGWNTLRSGTRGALFRVAAPRSRWTDADSSPGVRHAAISRRSVCDPLMPSSSAPTLIRQNQRRSSSRLRS